MGIEITAVAAPTTEREPNEFDALVPQVQALAANDQWAQVVVGTKGGTVEDATKEAESFKRKFGNAAQSANLSRKFAADVDNGDGTVTLKFTVRDKITRTRKTDAEAEAPAADAK